MPLPPNKSAWPPVDQAGRWQRMAVYDAWYSGDSTKLQRAYGGGHLAVTTGGPPTTVNPQGNRVTRAIRAGVSAFWGGDTPDGEDDTRRHLPTARDIASISSELLFADPPTITVDGPRYPDDVDDVKDDQGNVIEEGHHAGDPMPDTVRAQQRLDDLLDATGFTAVCLAAAETAAALGSVSLRIAWNKALVADRPLIVRVDGDASWPTYTWGVQQSVTFWRVVRDDDREVLRHLELHEGGKIYHGLYAGDSSTLGMQVPLSDGDAVTRGLVVDAEGALAGFALAPIDGAAPVTAVSIPNMLPDPLDRRGSGGASDYSEAVLDLLEAGDKTYSDMMNSIDDAKSRIIVSRALLETQGAGQGLSFNMNQRMFQRVNMPPRQDDPKGLPIEKVQFDMRSEEYLSAVAAIVDRTIQAAGYNTQTMGTDASGAPQTATEYAGRNKRSMSTRDKKIRYWTDALEGLLAGLLAVDAQEFNSGVTAYPVRVQFPEAVQPSMSDLLQDAAIMAQQKIASTTTIVQYIHPDWTPRQVDDEVERIGEATQVIDPITFGLGGAGITPEQPTSAPETPEQVNLGG